MCETCLLLTVLSTRLHRKTTNNNNNNNNIKLFSALITRIRTKSGTVTVNQREINAQFKSYYSELYTSKPTSDLSLFDNFFRAFTSQLLRLSYNLTLIDPSLLKKLHMPWKTMQSGKSPGPDGFLVEFFYSLLLATVSNSALHVFGLLILRHYLLHFDRPQSLYCYRRIKTLSIAVYIIQSHHSLSM